MTATERQRRVQFNLAWLMAVPIIVLPFFLGLSTGTQNANTVLSTGSMQYNAVALLMYVLVFCWITIRKFDRLNDFRRFPFRGSLLLGSAAGTLAALQFAIGLTAADGIAAYHQSVTIMTAEHIRDLSGMVICSVFAGAFFGGYFGLAAGGVYCTVRYLIPGRSVVVPISQRSSKAREQVVASSVQAGNRDAES